MWGFAGEVRCGRGGGETSELNNPSDSLASQPCDLWGSTGSCAQKGPGLSLLSGCHHLEMLSSFVTRVSAFFCTGLRGLCPWRWNLRALQGPRLSVSYGAPSVHGLDLDSPKARGPLGGCNVTNISEWFHLFYIANVKPHTIYQALCGLLPHVPPAPIIKVRSKT